jgi:hypothetical protein
MGTDIEVAIIMRRHGYVRVGMITAQRLADQGEIVYDNDCKRPGLHILYYREL